MSLCWYGVRVPANRERWATDVFGRHGFACYLPTEEMKRVIQRKPKRYRTDHKAIYSAHTFIGLQVPIMEDLQTWAMLASLPPYRGVLGMGQQPAQIPYQEIRAWAERVGQAGALTKAIARLKKGQHVRFSDGAFSNLPGTVIDILANGYTIEFKFLGSLRRVMVQDARLRPDDG